MYVATENRSRGQLLETLSTVNVPVWSQQLCGFRKFEQWTILTYRWILDPNVQFLRVLGSQSGVSVQHTLVG